MKQAPITYFIVKQDDNFLGLDSMTVLSILRYISLSCKEEVKPIAHYNPDLCVILSIVSPQAKYISTCIDEIKQELKQDNIAVKANAVCKLTYVSPPICTLHSWQASDVQM